MKVIMNTAIFLVFIVSFVSVCPIEKIEKSPEEGEFYEGDIVLSPLNFVNGVASRNLSLKWPNGEVPYYIPAEIYSKQEVENIKAAMVHIRDETMINGRPCINFVSLIGHTNYIQFANGTGCRSYVGKQGGVQNVILQTPNCVLSMGTVVHELLHALGFYHEQSRPDRDQYVTIMEDDIEPGKKRNFKLYDINTVDTLGFPYDYGSIMHYGKRFFGRNRSVTLVPKKKGVKIGQRDGLSEIDIAEIRAYYDCH